MTDNLTAVTASYLWAGLVIGLAVGIVAGLAIGWRLWRGALAAAELDAAMAAERADAERYRWLKARMKQDGDDYDAFLSTRRLFDDEWPKDLDAAIDAIRNTDTP